MKELLIENRHGELKSVLRVLAMLQARAHANAVAHGFWNNDDNLLLTKRGAALHRAALVGMMGREVSELLEAVRAGKSLPDKHLPEFTNEEVECADIILRVLDYAGGRQLRLPEALVAKHNFNTERPHAHGGKLF